MNAKVVPSEILFSLEEACIISTQCWRLARLAEYSLDENDRPGLRYAVRQLTEVLESKAFRLIDFRGRAYDPGMVPEIVEVKEDPMMPEGHAVIDDTVSPTVTWQGQVVRPGQVIIRRSPMRVIQNSEVAE